MKDIECPYCEHMFDFDETGYDHPDQDETVEFECPECEKIFHANASYDLTFSSEKKVDCKNGISECNFKKVYKYPILSGSGKLTVRCEHCDEKKYIELEDGIKYGYKKADILRGIKDYNNLYKGKQIDQDTINKINALQTD